ncbi:MAG: hypothetical protein GY769_12820, partial [bacterium]|nr:hypothetical protein [bacterium]
MRRSRTFPLLPEHDGLSAKDAGAEDPFGGADSWTQNFQNGFPVVTIGYGEDGGIEDESSLRSG